MGISIVRLVRIIVSAIISLNVIPGVCSYKVVAPAGAIETPNYPLLYPRTTTCEWILDFGMGMNVTIEFKDFDLEQQPNCTYDYMLLFKGNNRVTSPQLGENYCGFTAPGRYSFCTFFVLREKIFFMTIDVYFFSKSELLVFHNHVLSTSTT